MIETRLLVPNPRVLAVFAFRYDAHLVPDLIENIRPFVDGWISLDDRQARDAVSSEPDRQGALLDAARAAGARWVLPVDPDERFETGMREAMPELISADGPAAWSFRLRELYAPDAYRTDGIWGGKTVIRLFPLIDGQRRNAGALHAPWLPPGPDYQIRDSGINLYHLKMIAPARRRARRDLYAALDPERRLQAIGYDYLADEDGAAFAPVPAARGYHPPHREDGELWMPVVDAPGAAAAGDSEATLLKLADMLATRGDLPGAAAAAARAARAAPGSAPAHRRHAALAMRAGDFAAAAAAAACAAKIAPTRPPLQVMKKTADLLAAGGPPPAQPAIPPGAWPWAATQARLAALAPGESATIDTPWFETPTHVRRAASAPEAAPRMAVIAIGLEAPGELAAAVESLLAQRPRGEILAVNTGGGDLDALLGDRLAAVTAVNAAQRGYVGAARNLGVIASRAPLLGFLAGDCLADPGWIANRLAAHDAGAEAVAGAVANADPDSALDWAFNCLLFPRRMTFTPAARAGRYSVSYARRIFDDFGLFDSGLRVSEDTRLNQALTRAGIDIVWRPDAVLRHGAPATMRAAMAQMAARGRRNAQLNFRPGNAATGWRSLTALTRAARRMRASYADQARLALRAGEAHFPDAPLRRAQRLAGPLAAAYAAGWWAGARARLAGAKRLAAAAARLDDGHHARAADLARADWRRGGDPAALALLTRALGAARDDEDHGGTSPAPLDTLIAEVLASPARNAATLDIAAARAEVAGRRDRALARAEAALATTPTPARWRRVARQREATGDTPGARAAWRAASAPPARADANPDADAMLETAEGLARAGDAAAALDTLRLAAMTRPANAAIAAALERAMSRGAR